MTLRAIKRAILALLLLTVGLEMHAQATAQSAPYKFDFGVQLGMSGYIGDANKTNPYKHPGFDAELTFRYIPDTRWAIRGVLSTFNLSGNTADVINVLPEGAVYDFSSRVYALDARAEFNFFPYGIGETYKRLKRWTPYLTLGVGMAMSSSEGTTSFAPTLPMGLGVKFKLKPRLNLNIEFTMTKAFGDKVDSPNIVDLNQIKTEFYKSTDWYSRLTIGISYEFGKRCETCHYVD